MKSVPTRKAVIRKTDANERWCGYEEIGTLPHYWGEWKIVQLLWHSVWLLLRASDSRVTI